MKYFIIHVIATDDTNDKYEAPSNDVSVIYQR